MGKTEDSFSVLVVDDFPTMLTALVSCVSVLPGVGVVETASNGRDALEKANKSVPNVVITDLQMPIMDGFSLIRQLRALHPSIKLIAVSGHYSAAIEKEALAAGADAFVSKDLLPDALTSSLAKLW